GVALIDVGGGTTDVTVFHAGAVKHTAVLPLGGNHITNDVAAGLRTPAAAAEDIKRRYGSTMASAVQSDETIEVPSTGGREPRVMSRKVLAEIIQPRMEEILTLVRRELIRSGFDEFLTAGVVLTGGTVLLDGVTDLGEQVFSLPVRVGYPTGVGGLVDVVNSPSFSTGVGLVLYGASQGDSGQTFRSSGASIFEKVKTRMASWFAEHF
ncbi:cell division protein FtsA, partial [bacterium J17]